MCKIGRRIADAVLRGLDDDTESCICYDLAFAHKVEKISLPLRRVSKEEYDEAAAELAKAEKIAKKRPITIEEAVRLFPPQGVLDRWEEQKTKDRYIAEAHFVRIGDTVLTTNPFELFVEYSMRIRARAKAPQIFNVQLSNDSGGYLPTKAAVLGGSYSSKPASTKCGPEGGDLLVEKYIAEIDELMK